MTEENDGVPHKITVTVPLYIRDIGDGLFVGTSPMIHGLYCAAHSADDVLCQSVVATESLADAYLQMDRLPVAADARANIFMRALERISENASEDVQCVISDAFRRARCKRWAAVQQEIDETER